VGAVQLLPRQTSSVDVLQVCQRFKCSKVLGEVLGHKPVLSVEDEPQDVLRLNNYADSEVSSSDSRKIRTCGALMCLSTPGEQGSHQHAWARCRRYASSHRCEVSWVGGRARHRCRCCGAHHGQSSTDSAEAQHRPPGYCFPERRTHGAIPR